MSITGDWYVASIDEIECASRKLRHALDRASDALRDARSERLAGVDLVDIVQHLVMRGGKDLRLEPTGAFREYEQKLTAYRAAVIRILVDKHEMTFTQIGALTGVSRQMIARLYRLDRDEGDGSFDDPRSDHL